MPSIILFFLSPYILFALALTVTLVSFFSVPVPLIFYIFLQLSLSLVYLASRFCTHHLRTRRSKLKQIKNSNITAQHSTVEHTIRWWHLCEFELRWVFTIFFLCFFHIFYQVFEVPYILCAISFVSYTLHYIPTSCQYFRCELKRIKLNEEYLNTIVKQKQIWIFQQRLMHIVDFVIKWRLLYKAIFFSFMYFIRSIFFVHFDSSLTHRSKIWQSERVLNDKRLFTFNKKKAFNISPLYTIHTHFSAKLTNYYIGSDK